MWFLEVGAYALVILIVSSLWTWYVGRKTDGRS